MELPEVEVMRRDLERDVVGKKIMDVEVKGSKNAMRVIRRH
jgi:formamidopyrimidine-DNA glycosylase